MTIKLKQLPNREAKKLTIAIPPQIFGDLEDYAAIYAEVYGSKEQPAALVPSMLEAFLASDTGFKRAQKERQQYNAPSSQVTEQ